MPVNPWDKARKVVTFPVRADIRGAWPRMGTHWLVVVVKSCKDVRILHGSYGKRKEGSKVTAFCRCSDSGLPSETGCLGVIVYPANGWLGTGLMAHEATHAAARFVRYQAVGNSWRPVGKKVWMDEEKMCQAVGSLCHQITKGLYRAKVWPRKRKKSC